MRNDKIAVIGNKDVVLAFKAIGMDVYPADRSEEGEKVLKAIAKDYAVIFVTEDIAVGMRETLEKYKSKPYPAVIPIPSAQGSNGFGIDSIRSNVEKAVGTDVLFGREE